MPPGSQTLLICISIEVIVRHKNVDMHHQNVFELFCKNNKKKKTQKWWVTDPVP